MAEEKKPQHSMTRRSNVHDYSRPGIYHITMHVAEGLACPLGMVAGSSADTAAVALTAVGTAVEHQLLAAITAHYPMIAVDTYVVMPDHLHFILVVHDPIVSANGRSTHLGQVISGFKYGCNQAFWALTGQVPADEPCAAEPHSTVAAGRRGARAATGAAAVAATGAAAGARGTVAAGKAAAGAATVNGGSAARRERYSTGRPPLFARGYCDVMPIEPGQLDTMRNYIRNNPRSLWQRTHAPGRLKTRRDGIDTALTVAALRGYLRRECPAHIATDEALAQIERRLLLTGGGRAALHSGGGGKASEGGGKASGGEGITGGGGRIACHSYGERGLLGRRLLPVVCHRRDRARFEEQRRQCLLAAENGAVLVSPRIAKGEQTIIDEAAGRGFAVVVVADNGFPDRFHPSEGRLERCLAGRLLVVSPWAYEYRGKNDAVTEPFCKAMNCVAQAVCRMRDDWWKAGGGEQTE